MIPDSIHKLIRKGEWYNTIFGPEYEVRVYGEEAQRPDHITLLVHPDKIKEIKDKIKNDLIRDQ